jgi:hypothetical protein
MFVGAKLNPLVRGLTLAGARASLFDATANLLVQGLSPVVRGPALGDGRGVWLGDTSAAPECLGWQHRV